VSAPDRSKDSSAINLRMPIPILVDQIFCSSFPNVEPLVGSREHPDESPAVTGYSGLPSGRCAPESMRSPCSITWSLPSARMRRLISHRIHANRKRINRGVKCELAAHRLPSLACLNAALLPARKSGDFHAIKSNKGFSILPRERGLCEITCVVLGRDVGIVVWSETTATNVRSPSST